MSYSQDFRDKVLEVKQQENLTISSTAKRFCIGTTTLKRWLKNPMLKTTKNRPSTKIDLDALKAHIEGRIRNLWVFRLLLAILLHRTFFQSLAIAQPYKMNV